MALQWLPFCDSIVKLPWLIFSHLHLITKQYISISQWYGYDSFFALPNDIVDSKSLNYSVLTFWSHLGNIAIKAINYIIYLFIFHFPMFGMINICFIIIIYVKLLFICLYLLVFFHIQIQINIVKIIMILLLKLLNFFMLKSLLCDLCETCTLKPAKMESQETRKIFYCNQVSVHHLFRYTIYYKSIVFILPGTIKFYVKPLNSLILKLF